MKSTAHLSLQRSQMRGRWLVVDERGRVHSSTPQPKAKAQAQADAMNAALAKRVK